MPLAVAYHCQRTRIGKRKILNVRVSGRLSARAENRIRSIPKSLSPQSAGLVFTYYRHNKESRPGSRSHDSVKRYSNFFQRRDILKIMTFHVIIHPCYDLRVYVTIRSYSISPPSQLSECAPPPLPSVHHRSTATTNYN